MVKNYIIHNQIKTLRFFANEMTQLELANKIGVSRQTIIAIESEKYNPSLELAFKISHVFDKKVDDVFRFEEKPTKK